MSQRKSKLDEYLEQGIYGKKEINPAERKKFLGTIRERIVIALTIHQVYESKVYSEVEKEMIAHPKTKLLLNGAIPYDTLRKYIKVANQNNIPFTIVENKESDTDIGLVLTYDHYAIEKDEIYVKDTEAPESPKQKKVSSKSQKENILKKLFSKGKLRR